MTGIRQGTISEICRNTKQVMNFSHAASLSEGGKGRKEKELKWLLPIVVNCNGKEIDVVSLVKVNNEEGDRE